METLRIVTWRETPEPDARRVSLAGSVRDAGLRHKHLGGATSDKEHGFGRGAVY